MVTVITGRLDICARKWGILKMDATSPKQAKLAWIEPEIVELDVVETQALPNRGADVGGNPYVDCQRS